MPLEIFMTKSLERYVVGPRIESATFSTVGSSLAQVTPHVFKDKLGSACGWSGVFSQGSLVFAPSNTIDLAQNERNHIDGP